MDTPKFESFQRVRVLEEATMDNPLPRRPRPEETIMGKIGIVETFGTVYGTGIGSERYLLPAYFIRVKGFGQVLVGEDWLEDATVRY